MPPIRAKRNLLWLHYKEGGNNEATCNYCATKLSTKNGSLGTLKRHLTNKHPTISLNIERQPASNTFILPPNSEILAQPSTSSAAPIHSSTSATATSANRFMMPSSSGLITDSIRKPPSTRKVEQIDQQVVAMVTKGHHSFRIVDEPEFRKLMDLISTCPGYKLPTRKTLSNTLIPKCYTEVFEIALQNIKGSFAVCLCTDAWTSSATQSYIAVTAHFINQNTEMKSVLLGCVNYNDRHTSENLVVFLRQMIEDWQISNKVICVVSDNAANIQAAIRLGDWRPVGCFAHTLNLIVQYSIKTIDESLTKVKAIVEFFKRSYTAQAKLQATLKQMGLPLLKLKQECPTRWNSCYDMIQRIVKIKDAVISTLALIRTDLSLQTEDWETIEKVVPILEPFYEITKEISTESHVSLSKVLVFSNIMYKHIAKEMLKQNDVKLKAFLEKLHNQVTTRFKDLESNVLYSDSCILDPRFKKKGFRTPEAYERALDGLRSRVAKIQLKNEDVPVQFAEPLQDIQQGAARVACIWDEFDAEMAHVTRPSNSTVAALRELDKYCDEEYINRKEDPLKWWHSRRSIYPRLYQMVLKRLCIQATSVSCERVFSGAGQLISSRRQLLKPSKVNQVLFLHGNM